MYYPATIFVALALISFVLLLTPTGSLPSASWRWWARSVVAAAVDRRFNRRKYDAGKTLEGFRARQRDGIDIDAVSAELLTVVNHTTQPTIASLWLRPSGRQPQAQVRRTVLTARHGRPLH